MVVPFESEGPLNNHIKEQIRQTGLSAVKVSIGGSDGTYDETNDALDFYDREIILNDDIYMSVTSVDDIDAALASNRLGIIKSFEASTMFDGDPARIKEFASRGVKVMQLGYNKTSPFGAGVMSVDGPLGLSDLGREAVSVMQDNGVLLDLSHAHEETMRGALEAAIQPVAVTHSGCAAIHPHQRNKSDAMLKSISGSGGVFGLYELSYLTPGMTQTPLSAYMAHLEHALKVCGEDHVGIGSDTLLLEFDTGPESKAQWDAVNAARKQAGIAAPGEGPMPFVIGLNGPQRMSVIMDQLKKLGYSAAAIDKVMGLNFKRIFHDTWQA